LDAGLADGGDSLDFVFDIIHEDIAHATARGRESDLDLDGPRAILVGLHLATIYQPELDNVDRDLGIVTGAHLVPGELADIFFGRVGGQLRRLDRLLADGIGVLARDPEEVALEI